MDRWRRDLEIYGIDPDDAIEEDGLNIIAPEEEEEGWCENEDVGIQCSFPYCNCPDPPYVEVEQDDELIKELPEMFSSASIDDAFWDD